MANDEHVALLKKGVAAWNQWREENADIRRPDLVGADLNGANLTGADLRGADLSGANLSVAHLGAHLSGAHLSGAHLRKANLTGADLRGAELAGADLRGATLRKARLGRANLAGVDLVRANLIGANLSGACLREAFLYEADLGGVDLVGANLSGARASYAGLSGADLAGADLSGAELNWANLNSAKLVGANLARANLTGVTLVMADLTGADLTGCRIYGVSAWSLEVERTKQQNLVITREFEPEITVDNIEVAQFIYLMLNNQRVRDVIDTITSKVVLILGRFTDERKAVLDALREELRKRNYLPILFDFNVPATRDITETVSLLARMARFIIADLTDPSSIPKELEAIVPGLAVPVQPLLEGASRPYAMFKDYWKYEWVLPVYRYEGLEPLLATLAEKVIAPAEGKVKALQERRRMIEAELTKPQ
jgi:uncharacterized protein YjbI with pentapeptide repeats